jgi:aminoglycoside 3-N-acetyltransferase I
MTANARRIRRLGPGDLSLFRDLNALFGDVFGEPETYTGQPRSDAEVRGALGQDHVIALVALVEETVVGGLVAYELDKLEQARREIYIYDLAVAAAHRRQGIATALIETVRAIARERGAWMIYVQADNGDDPAIALYQRLGRREEVLHFDFDP